MRSVIWLSSVGTVVAVLVVWGTLGRNLGGLVAFVLVYGVFASGWSAMWVGMAREIQIGVLKRGIERDISGESNADGEESDRQEVGIGVLMGLLSAGRGLGSVVCGPVSEVLLRFGGWEDSIGGFGTEYGVLILFTSSTAVAAGIICAGLRGK